MEKRFFSISDSRWDENGNTVYRRTEVHAAKLAQSHKVRRNAVRQMPLEELVKKSFQAVSKCVRHPLYDNGSIIKPEAASEWLSDNFYLLEEQYFNVLDEMHGKNFTKLPVLLDGLWRDYPRIFAVSLDYLKTVEGVINKQQLAEYIEAYQRINVLDEDELKALPLVLKSALMVFLGEIADDVLGGERGAEKGGEFVELLTNQTYDESKIYKQFAILNNDKNFLPSVIRELEHMPAGNEKKKITAVLDELAYKAGETRTYSAIINEDHRDRAKRQTITANIVTSFRTVVFIPWDEMSETLSKVDAVLAMDPAGKYSIQTKETKEMYRRAVARKAEKYKINAVEYAQNVLDNALKANKGTKASHVGYWIIDQGKDFFEDNKCSEALPARLYPGVPLAVALIAALAAAFVMIGHNNAYGFCLIEMTIFILTAIFIFIPLAGTVLTVFFNIVREKIKSTQLPALDYKDGIPDGSRVMVIVPVLLTSERSVGKAICGIEKIYAGNRDKNICVAIVGDFKDAEKPDTEKNQEIIEKGIRDIRRMNEKYGSNTFYYFQRKQVYNEKTNTYMGEERKRGAVLATAKLVTNKNERSCCFDYFEKTFEPDSIPDIRYIFTVDADTFIMPESIAYMAGIADHPLNRPTVETQNEIGKGSPGSFKVTSGYGMLQPEVAISYESAHVSAYTGLFAGKGTMDPYSVTGKDIYQCIFGEGIYNGKGMFDAETFCKVLDGAFPKNSILSHDLLEGSYLRTGLCEGIEVVDDYPSGYVSSALRQHRWIRGDWQLLGYLRKTIKNEFGENIKNPLDRIARWKIADNLRRSMIPLAIIFLLLVGLVAAPQSGGAYFAVALVLIYSEPLVTVLTPSWWKNTATEIYNTVKTHAVNYSINGLQQLSDDIARNSIRFLTLPYNVWVYTDAAIRATYRRLISRKNMLQWVTSSDTEKSLKKGLYGYYRTMWQIPVAAMLVTVTVLINHVSAREMQVAVLYLVLAIFWLFAPYVIWRLDRRYKTAEEKNTINSEEKKFLMFAAHKTWSFYEDFVRDNDNFLPPDNFQEKPVMKIAHHTSPTNIGCYILSAISAYDLGFISYGNLIKRLHATVSTLVQMQKYEGHLYNWYDTRTLQPLAPRYISTVDSGNLLCALITLKQFLEEKRDKKANNAVRLYWICMYNEKIFSGELPPDGKSENEYNYRTKEFFDEAVDNQSFEKLYGDVKSLMAQMDFSRLFNSERKLFVIGINAETGKEDNSCYDLMASEAMQTMFAVMSLGQVSARYWRRPGRRQTVADGYVGLLSWTGTMFEYLMPYILLKVYPETLFFNAAEFIIRAQQAYCKRKNIPWGMSESAYYAFDMNLSYQYKAFGLPGAALKRGMERETVIAPYATALALGFFPHDAIKNLRKLDGIGAQGSYGFYDAVDYTPRHIGEEKYRIVQTYMAHHQGMLLASINNLINSKILSKRFCSLPENEAHLRLLTEKEGSFPRYTPKTQHADTTILRNRKQMKKLKEKRDKHGFETVITAETKNGSKHECGIVTNGSYTVINYADGSGRAFWGDTALYCDTFGIYADGKRIIPDRAEFYPEKTVYRSEGVKFLIKTTIWVTADSNTEMHLVEIMNKSSDSDETEIRAAYTPVLAKIAEYEAHPAYSRMFLQTEFAEDMEVMMVKRRRRNVSDTLYRGILGFAGDGNCGFASCAQTDTLIPEMSISINVKIKPGATAKMIFYAGLFDDTKKCINAVQKYSDILTGQVSLETAATRSRIEYEYLNITQEEAVLFMRLSTYAVTQGYKLNSMNEKINNDISIADDWKIERIWRYGISGDDPVILVSISGAEDIRKFEKMIKLHRYLGHRGIDTELVAAIYENDNIYGRPLMCKARAAVENVYGEQIINRSRGVFLLDVNRMEQADLDMITFYSSIEADKVFGEQI